MHSGGQIVTPCKRTFLCRFTFSLIIGAVAAENLTCVRDWSGITQPYYWNFTVRKYNILYCFFFI